VQVIYIMGVFMFVFSVVMGLTTTLTRSAMQNKLDNVAQVGQMFDDIENGVNNGILSNQSDLRYLDNTQFSQGSDDEFSRTAATRVARDSFNNELLDYVSWSEDQLLTDPWGTDIRVYYASEYVLFDDNVEALETSFAYISAGPNRNFETSITPAGSISNTTILALEPPAGSDDIVNIFTTRPAAIRTWENTLNMIIKMAGLIESDYTEQYVQFLPEIENYNILNNNLGFDSSALNAWSRDAALWTAEGPSGTGNYPIVAQDNTDLNALGLGEFVNVVPMFGVNSAANFLSMNPYGGALRLRTDRTRLRFRVNRGGVNDANVGWRVNFNRTIDGRTVISN